MNKKTPHISLKRVYFGYKKAHRMLLENVSLEIPPGSILRLSGPSGSGKTTFLELVGGILLPNSGNIQVEEIHTKSLKKNRFSLFGYSFVNADFFENMSLQDNILMPANSMNIPIDMKWYHTLIRATGLLEHTKKRICHLSAGQRERANLVRTLIHKPKILILDEPGSHLDDILIGKIIQIILDYYHQEKPTIFISSHRDFPLIHFDFLLSFHENFHLSIETNTEPQD